MTTGENKGFLLYQGTFKKQTCILDWFELSEIERETFRNIEFSSVALGDFCVTIK
jgi:hypothetical protein